MSYVYAYPSYSTYLEQQIFPLVLYKDGWNKRYQSLFTPDAYESSELRMSLFSAKKPEHIQVPTYLLHREKDQARRYVITQLVAQWFTWFVTHPYATWNEAIAAVGMWLGYEVLRPITDYDILDIYLEQVPSSVLSDDTLEIPAHVWTVWDDIFLFKTTQDLFTMWYEVVSHRSRINNDLWYRRFNIAQSFSLLWHVKVLSPWDELLFMQDAQYDRYQQQHYKVGYVVVWDEEKKEYGGGMCGASTALYQGLLTNKALKPLALKNHSKWHSYLYNADINFASVHTPGLDSAIYAWALDLHLRNISAYPVIIVMNYDGSYGWYEQVFSLAHISAQWSFSFSYRSGNCYVRLINNEERMSCYKQVN